MDIVAAITYIALQTATPGPNNLMWMFYAAQIGMKRAKWFYLGSMFGLGVKLLLCGFLNIFLASSVPGLMPYLKWVGAIYLLYLAYHIYKSRPPSDSEGAGHNATFMGGILLQVLNIKSWIFALSVFSIYVTPYSTSVADVFIWSGISLALGIAASFMWAFFGAAIKRVYASHAKAVNIVMALALSYCAVAAVI